MAVFERDIKRTLMKWRTSLIINDEIIKYLTVHVNKILIHLFCYMGDNYGEYLVLESYVESEYYELFHNISSFCEVHLLIIF